jgi:PAS domain S-box-containing protein
MSTFDASSERAERLASLLMLSHEPMLAWRLDGSIEFWNAGAERLYGFAAKEAVGCVSHSLLQTKNHREAVQPATRGRRGGEYR